VRKTLSALFVILCAVVGAQYYSAGDSATPASAPDTGRAPVSDVFEASIEQAWRERRSSVQVRDSGNVSRILPDDTNGDRHQRFVLALPSGHTVLIAHNIDLAPRIEDLAGGDRVSFFGEYEWNEQGGVIHWTHHDPAGRHTGGWLEHGGVRYE
jgi:hypothetical protein